MHNWWIYFYRYSLLTNREVDMAGHALDREGVEVNKNTMKLERDHYPVILTQRIWSIKDLFMAKTTIRSKENNIMRRGNSAKIWSNMFACLFVYFAPLFFSLVYSFPTRHFSFIYAWVTCFLSYCMLLFCFGNFYDKRRKEGR